MAELIDRRHIAGGYGGGGVRDYRRFLWVQHLFSLAKWERACWRHAGEVLAKLPWRFVDTEGKDVSPPDWKKILEPVNNPKK